MKLTSNQGLSPEAHARANLEARALKVARAYEANPLRGTRRKLLEYYEVCELTGSHAVASRIAIALGSDNS
jgi:hypothetical protein